jgi:outer membrane receptor protein involved in Fe transport
MWQSKKFSLTMIAAAVAAIPMASHAQASAQGLSAGDSPLERVTVTATKREAILTDVSLGISALSDKALEARGISSLEELGASSPGMNIIKTSPGENLLVSRGISTSQSLSIQSGPAVGVYIDEMPLVGLNSGVPDFGMWDVSRVEMLRGPQGTLYGEGAMAGTIRIISVVPDARKLSGKVQVTGSKVDGGSAGQSVRGMLNVPLSEGVAAMRATVSYNKNPAWIDAPELAKQDANTNTQNDARIAFRITPNDKLKIDASLWRQSSDAVHGSNQTTPGVYSPTSLGKVAGVSPIANGQLNTDIRTSDSANVTVSYDFTGFSLVSATSQTKQNADFVADSRDTLPIALVALGVPSGSVPFVLDGTELSNSRTRNLNMTSQELRLVSHGDHRLNWTVGGYFKKLDRHVDNNWHVLVPLVLGPADNSTVVSDTTSNSKAYFGEMDWKASSTVTLTGGLRAYTDDRVATANVKNFSNVFTVPVGLYTSTVTEQQTTYNLIASWRPSNTLNLFARAASGFRSGGPNLWVQDPINIPKDFKSEKLNSIELGVKSNPTSWIVANAYLFKNEWSDKQINLSTPSGLYDYTSNAGAAQAQGAEFEFQVYPTKGMSLSSALTYTDATITKDLLDSNGKVSAKSGSRLPYVSPWELKTSIDYRWLLAEGRQGIANLTYVYRAANFSEISNAPATDNGSLNQINLRAGVEATKKAWGVFGFVRNLTNSQSVTTIQQAAGGGYGVRYSSYIQPRTIGIELQAAF